MSMDRRNALAVMIGTLAASGMASGAEMQIPSPITDNGRTIKAFRVFKGPDGNSHVEEWPLHAKPVTFPAELHFPDGFQSFFESTAVRLSIQSGPPNMHIPAHTSEPGKKEMFFVLQGSARSIFKNGETFEVGPGTLVFVDDVGGTGHASESGPEGYTHINATLTT